MIKKFKMITNNKMVADQYGDKLSTEYIEGMDYSAVLLKCRELIHEGYILETHPLSGSIKPNETPFKSVILSEPKVDTIQTDPQSLLIIEDSIETYNKFLKNRPTPNWIGEAVNDFMKIDLSLIKSVIEKIIVV